MVYGYSPVNVFILREESGRRRFRGDGLVLLYRCYCYFFDLDFGLFSDLAFFVVGLLLDESSVVMICSLFGLVKLSLIKRDRERWKMWVRTNLSKHLS